MPSLTNLALITVAALAATASSAPTGAAPAIASFARAHAPHSNEKAARGYDGDWLFSRHHGIPPHIVSCTLAETDIGWCGIASNNKDANEKRAPLNLKYPGAVELGGVRAVSKITVAGVGLAGTAAGGKVI